MNGTTAHPRTTEPGATNVMALRPVTSRDQRRSRAEHPSMWGAAGCAAVNVAHVAAVHGAHVAAGNGVPVVAGNGADDGAVVPRPRRDDEDGSLVTEYGLLAVVAATVAGVVIQWASGGALVTLFNALLRHARELVGA